jgi:hypothetical protein
MIQADTLAVVTEIANTVGGEVSSLVALVLGVVIKIVVDLGKKASVQLDTAPASVKALVVAAFGQLAAFISAKTGVFVSPDIAVLDASLVGLTLAAVSMGVHGLTKTVFAPAKDKLAK